MHSIFAKVAGLIHQLTKGLSRPPPPLEALPHSFVPGRVGTRTVRLVRQNGSEFVGSLHEVCVVDALKILSSCVDEFLTRVEDDKDFHGTRGFRLIRDEADYLRISVVGTNEVQVTTDFLSGRYNIETALSAHRIHFSAEIAQTKKVLEQYFSKSREDFEDTYHEYIVGHIGENPSKLASATTNG